MKSATRTITLDKDSQKLKHMDRVWELLEEGYKDVKGGLFFTSKTDLLLTTAKWKVIVYNNIIIAVTIYKAKKGLKLVAMTASKIFKDYSIKALARLIKRDLKKCWMELSEAAERFVMKNGGINYVIPNSLVAQIVDKDITLSADGVHYSRTINNITKEKILLGTVAI